MKLISTLLLFCMGFTSCHSQSQDMQNCAAIKEQASALNKYAQQAISGNVEKKTEALTHFFKSFPNNFKTFYRIYGNDDKSADTCLLKVSNDYMLFTLLPELKKAIPTNEYYKKMIQVGIGGHWEADEVAALQHHLQEIVPENIKLSVDLLKEYEEKQIKSFWRFFYDGPHPDDPEIKKLYGSLYPKISQINPKVSDSMKQAYDQLLAEDDGHGH